MLINQIDCVDKKKISILHTCHGYDMVERIFIKSPFVTTHILANIWFDFEENDVNLVLEIPW